MNAEQMAEFLVAEVRTYVETRLQELRAAMRAEIVADIRALPAGPPGPVGPAGPPGPEGPRGLFGVGKDGERGADGKDGKDAKDGRDGRDGKDGITPDELARSVGAAVDAALFDAVAKHVAEVFATLPTLEYQKTWTAGQQYRPGHIVTWDGGMWHCNTATTEKPGTNGHWTLAVKRGRDGRDR